MRRLSRVACRATDKDGFMEFLNVAFLAALLQIMVVNVVLSGDNAVVIALAARNLPTHHQKQAILWGSGGAIVLRVLLTKKTAISGRKSSTASTALAMSRAICVVCEWRKI